MNTIFRKSSLMLSRHEKNMAKFCSDTYDIFAVQSQVGCTPAKSHSLFNILNMQNRYLW